MVKSFLNALFGGLGRTFGRIIAYIIIALIFFFIYENAHAEEININSSVYGDTGYNNMYWGQNYYNGSLSNSNFTIGTRYTGRLAVFVLDIRRSFVANTVYTIYVYAPTNDFRNTLEGVIVDDLSNVTGCTTITSQFVSKTKLKSSFVCPQNTSRIQMQWYADEGSYLTGDTNFNINKITLEIESTSGSNNDDIINNNNQNTDDIINNNNSNTQDIINNNNQNTQDIINNQNENTNSVNNTIENVLGSGCQNNLFNPNNIFNGLASDNVLKVNNSTRSYYFLGAVNTTYSIQRFDNGSGLGTRYQIAICDGISAGATCTSPIQGNGSNQRANITTGSNGNQYVFIYVTNNINSLPVLNIFAGSNSFATSYSKSYCSSKLDDVTGAIDDVSNSLNDTSDIDTNIFSTWLNNFNPINNPLGSVITLPISLAQKIVGYNSESCLTINLGSLFGTSLLLRCFSLSSVLPDNAGSLVSIIDTIMAISLLVVIIKNSYETIANIISLGGENKVKSHFRLPTPLEFMSSILNGNGYSEYVDYR